MYVKSEDYEKAISQYKEWVKREPNKPAPFVAISIPYYKEKEFKRSAVYLKKAFEIDKDLAVRAVKSYSNFIKSDSYSWDVFYHGAEKFLDEQKFELAGGLAEKAEEVSSGRRKAMAHVLHGKSLLGKEEKKEALGLFQAALDLDDENLDAYISLGKIYTAQGNPEKAITHAEKALALDSTCFRCYKLVGQNYLRVQKYNLAVEVFEKASSIKDNDPSLLYELACAYLQKEDYSRAEGIGEKILGLPNLDAKTKTETYILLGISNMYKKDYDKAIESLKEAIEVTPDNCDSYQLLVQALNKIAKEDLAREFAKKWEECVNQ